MTGQRKASARIAFAGVLWLASTNWAHATVTRGNVTLDDGVTVVVVDTTATAWTATEVTNLVVAADRSTKDDCIWLRATKGLFQAGDRIFVNYNYLAWISASAGTIRGLWALNSATKDFRDYRTGPEGCSWAHNQLIPGSASPQGQFFHWDQHAPPIEHTINFEVSPGVVVGVNHATAFQTSSGNVQVLYDGTELSEGVIYATGVRMAAFIGTGFTVDVYDGNEANGIQNWVDSNLASLARIIHERRWDVNNAPARCDF